MALKLEELELLKSGDFLVLRDIHTMEATGKPEFSTPITATRIWKNQSLRYVIAEVQPAADVRLALIAKTVGAATDLVLYRCFEEQIGNELQSVSNLWVPNATDGSTDFSSKIFIEVDGDRVQYDKCQHYPFWDLQGYHILNQGGSTGQIGICEYRTQQGDPGAWNHNGLIEYYYRTGRLATVWLGWDVQPTDFDVLRK